MLKVYKNYLSKLLT